MVRILLIAVVPFMTQHRNVVPKTEVSTNFYGSVTGIVDKAYIEARVGAGGGGGGCDTNAVDALANSAVVTNAITVATTNRVAALETETNNLSSSVSSLASSKADKSALTAHTENTDNPHGVTAEQIGAVPFVEDKNGKKTAVTIGSRLAGTVGPGSIANGDYVYAEGNGSHAAGYRTFAVGDYSRADGGWTEAIGYGSRASGIRASTHLEDAYSYAWNGNGDPDYGVYYSHGVGTFNINPIGGLDGFYIGEQTLAAILLGSVTNNISATNPSFSNAVLAVQISTNDFAALYALKEAFADLPIDPVTGGISIGALLAALASAIAWLKKNKVGSFASVGGASATVESGVAKLDDFFTESNSLLTGTIKARLPYPLNAVTDERNATGLKDRAFNALTFDGTEYNLSTALAAATPTASGQPRDLLIVATATAATTISFTAGTIKGDKPTIDGAGTWLITLTEYAANTWYCRQIKMEDAA